MSFYRIFTYLFMLIWFCVCLSLEVVCVSIRTEWPLCTGVKLPKKYVLISTRMAKMLIIMLTTAMTTMMMMMRIEHTKIKKKKKKVLLMAFLRNVFFFVSFFFVTGFSFQVMSIWTIIISGLTTQFSLTKWEVHSFQWATCIEWN